MYMCAYIHEKGFVQRGLCTGVRACICMVVSVCVYLGVFYVCDCVCVCACTPALSGAAFLFVAPSFHWSLFILGLFSLVSFHT